MKGELIEHDNGVYTVRRDPQVHVVYGIGRSLVIRYTHQLTPEVLDLAWQTWCEELQTPGEPDLLPPARVRWWRQIPCHPNSWEASEGWVWMYRLGEPGAHGVFPCIEFNADTPAIEHRRAPSPPYMIDVHLPEVCVP